MRDDLEARMYARITGAVLVWTRNCKGLSQRALAVASGVSQSSISRFEYAAVLPDAHALRRLALALGTTSVQLIATVELVWSRVQACVAAARDVGSLTWWEVPLSTDFLAGVVALALADAEKQGVIDA